jgi:hypothetical protein
MHHDNHADLEVGRDAGAADEHEPDPVPEQELQPEPDAKERAAEAEEGSAPQEGVPPGTTSQESEDVGANSSAVGEPALPDEPQPQEERDEADKAEAERVAAEQV